MAVIEIDGIKFDEDKLMRLKPQCPCCRQRETRLILPTAGWNASGKFILHCYVTGRLHTIDDIVKLLTEQNLLDQVKIPD